MGTGWRGTMGAALALALLAGPLAGPAGAGCNREGDPAFYVGMGGVYTAYPGETFVVYIAPCNFGIASVCDGSDTFCVDVSDTGGWTIAGDPPLGGCTILDPGYFMHQHISIAVPCEAMPGDRDTIIAVMAYCADGACDPFCLDLPGCEDPNIFEGAPYYSADTLVVEVAAAPPQLAVLADTLVYVAWSQDVNFVPFSICNADPCAPVDTVDYAFSGAGLVPWSAGYPLTGSVEVAGGECADVYAVLDASVSEVCDFDTIVLVAWDRATGSARDTGETLVHVIPVMPVPLFAPTVVVLVVVIALAAGAFFLRRGGRRRNP